MYVGVGNNHCLASQLTSNLRYVIYWKYINILGNSPQTCNFFLQESPSKDGKKKNKKDKKARMPSFSFGKKKDSKKSKVQTAV